MNEIKVNYTLAELKAHVDSRYNVISRSNAHRSSSSEDELLTASIIITGTNVSITAYVSTFVAHTTDNYLVTTTLYQTSYGAMCKDKYFGVNTSTLLSLRSVFSTLPADCQDELRATEWLAKNPKKLVDKFSQILNVSASLLESNQRDIADIEGILVNAHHNMKKSAKSNFSIAWSKWNIVKAGKLPWFAKCLKDFMENK